MLTREQPQLFASDVILQTDGTSLGCALVVFNALEHNAGKCIHIFHTHSRRFPWEKPCAKMAQSVLLHKEKGSQDRGYSKERDERDGHDRPSRVLECLHYVARCTHVPGILEQRLPWKSRHKYSICADVERGPWQCSRWESESELKQHQLQCSQTQIKCLRICKLWNKTQRIPGPRWWDIFYYNLNLTPSVQKSVSKLGLMIPVI